jgi:CubicO group peptidase (beta-lactamase class C family)
MRRYFLIVTAAVLVLFHVPARGQGLVYEVFGTYLDSLRSQAGIPGLAAAIVDDGRVVWEGAYGYQDLGRAIATRTDTPFNADGLTQIFTAAMLMRCEEERRLSLDDRVGSFAGPTPEPDASIRQILTHTSGAPQNLTYALRPSRFEPLTRVVRACAVDSYRETFSNLLRRVGMRDSVPGPNIITVRPPAEGVPDPADVERYRAVLERRALPYAVNGRGRASGSTYPASAATLTASSGLVTTVRDLAKFDRALREDGLLVKRETLATAWSTPVDSSGQALPHGIGWFVQHYKGEKIVWQFGAGEDASSSLMLTVADRGLTLIVMANSDRLVKPFSLDDGDVSLSPFARMFLKLFVR